ncbi:MAG: hypothetical protein K0U64_05300 [Actinomycetia bacterium]|nr:hypothetical protein [Actinomycetes bacterium]
MKAPEGRQYGAGNISLASLELLSSAVQEIELAVVEPTPARRYLRGYAVAVRTAAAVLATRTTPALNLATRTTPALNLATRTTPAPNPAAPATGPQNVWVLLARVAPELQEWAMFFAAGAGKQAALAAGLDRAITARESDDLVRDSHNFLDIVVSSLMRGSGQVSPRIRVVS